MSRLVSLVYCQSPHIIIIIIIIAAIVIFSFSASGYGHDRLGRSVLGTSIWGPGLLLLPFSLSARARVYAHGESWYVSRSLFYLETCATEISFDSFDFAGGSLLWYWQSSAFILLNVYSFKVLVILFMKHQKILHLTKNASYLATKLNFMKDDCNVDF